MEMINIKNIEIANPNEITPDDIAKEDNLFGIKDEDFDKIIKNFSLHISNIDFNQNMKDLLINFYMAEMEIKDYIKSMSLLKNEQKNILILFAEEMLEQKFNDKSNKFCSKILSSIDNSYENLVNNEIKKTDFEPHFSFLNNEDKKGEVNFTMIKETFRGIISSFYQLFLAELRQNLNKNKVHQIDSLPEFLIKSYKRKIKLKVKSLCNDLIKQHYQNIIENKIEVTTLKHFFTSYGSNSINLFDYQCFSSILESLFNIFILSNKHYFDTDINAFNIFMQNLPKYVKIFHLQKKDNSESLNEDYYVNKRFDNIRQTMLDLPSSEIEDMLRINIDTVKNFIRNSNEKFFFIIFSYSMMLNNIVKVEGKNVVMNDDLRCNSRERQFLINVLKSLKNYFMHEYDPFTINSYSQSIIINNILKSQCVEMYDKNLEKKEKLTIDKIEEVVTQSEVYDLVEEFTDVLNLCQVSPKDDDDKKSYVSVSYMKSMLKKAMIYLSNQEDKVNLDDFAIVPFDNFTLSPNACICVSGYTSDGLDQERAWENLTVDLNKFIDFYFMNWPSETFSSLLKEILIEVGKAAFNIWTENYIKLAHDIHAYMRSSNTFLKARKNAKICGKLLAYIIASKTFYKFQTVTLVGFSLGSHLIKSCLKQLYKLSRKEEHRGLENVIQNVVFVAGATCFKNEKWKEIFDTLVAGRVVNCYGKNDNILKFLFKITTSHDAIGLNNLDLKSEKIENYDFTDLGIDHHEYRKSLSEILKRIKLH